MGVTLIWRANSLKIFLGLIVINKTVFVNILVEFLWVGVRIPVYFLDKLL